MNELLLIILGLLLSHGTDENSGVRGADIDLVNDGPHIYQEKGRMKAEWVRNNIFMEEFISPDNFSTFSSDFNLAFSYEDLNNTFLIRPNHVQRHKNADSIAVISDIHGNYHVYANLLKGNGIIDNNMNWNFGKGHLVVLGDIFDRGDMVTEVLWHLFGLEKQAEKAGGKVHVLLGNHELMALRNDLCYASPKYAATESFSMKSFADNFSGNTVLGYWLRTKPVVIAIDNILFTHAGISHEMVRRKMHVRKINRIFAEKIIGRSLYFINERVSPGLLHGINGPVWYRGYFNDPHLYENTIDEILDFYGMNHIVVGHTPNASINLRFSDKIFGTDTGMCHSRSGEILIYKEGYFYQGFSSGKRIKI